MADDETTLELRGLDQILKALKAKPPVARVGILGANATARHGKSTSSNAEVGAAHEYGAPARHLPQRSFLRVPITLKLNKEMEASHAFDNEVLKEVIKHGDVRPWLKNVVDLAVKVVDDAFATGGFGTWTAWKNPNYTNNTGMILVDTTQLRNSITGEVE